MSVGPNEIMKIFSLIVTDANTGEKKYYPCLLKYSDTEK